MPSEALKKALRFEDLNIKLAERMNRTSYAMPHPVADRFDSLYRAIYARLSPEERDAANRYSKRQWRMMGGKVNANDELVLPRLKRIEQARRQ